MLHLFDGLRDVSISSVLFRMLLAFLCGALIGLERSYKNRPAGFRTHILVCIGATVVSATGIYLAVNRRYPTDLSRLGAQFVSGLGFIGGGTIILTGTHKLKGLTTAAGLWASGIIGLAIGAGFYEGALLSVIFVLCVEIFLFNIGSRIRQTPEYHMQLVYTDKNALDNTLRYSKDKGFAIHNLQVTRMNDSEKNVYMAYISLHSRKFTTSDVLLEHAKKTAGIISVKMTEG